MDVSKLFFKSAFFTFIITFCSCAAIGTKTIYRTNAVPNINSIGYCELSDDEFLTSIYPQTNDVFNTAIEKIVENYGLPTPKRIEFIDKNITTLISELCEANNIDALLITHLRFVNTTYTMSFVPVADNLDTEVQMMLYDKQGDLLFSTKHNTFSGNSYMKLPPTHRTITDGIKGAFKRIAKEMGLKPIK